MQVTPALNAGGVESVTLDTARVAAAAGARSLVASRGGRFEKALKRGGSALVRLPVDSRNPWTMMLNARRLADVIRRDNVSLVHVRSRAPAFSVLAAARATGTPVVTSYHGVYSAGSAIKRWYNGVMTRGDLVIANSRFTRDHIIAEHQTPADRIVVIPEGVDTARFDPARVPEIRRAALRARWGLDPGDTRRVIFLPARLTPWKGQGLMIRALGRRATRGDAVLALAGAPDDPAYIRGLQDLAAADGLADQVRFVGETDDMPAAYAIADLVVAPSTKPESFGRAVVEAAAMARPVIASALGGPAETIAAGETGWLAPAGDVEAWALALDEALALPPEAVLAMGRAARDRARRLYSLAPMLAATFTVYRRLAEGDA